MPTRRKNVDLGRLKRSSKRSKIFDLCSSAYVQYLLIFLIWGALLLIYQSTEMRFEYFWPGWLFMCSIHDSFKFKGLQYTIVFIIIVITCDLICFFLVPTSWIYSCGSAYVWVYLLWHTDQGLCFLSLSFCFVFVYFELGFHSRGARPNTSIYLFRPFAAHSIGYPVVCMGFSIKQFLDTRHRKFKKLEVRRQNCVYFRILREAIPYSASLECSSGAYQLSYLPDNYEIHGTDDDFSKDSPTHIIPWSLFLIRQLRESLQSRFCRWSPFSSALCVKECNGQQGSISPSSSSSTHALHRHGAHGTNNNSHPIGNGAITHAALDHQHHHSLSKRSIDNQMTTAVANRKCGFDGGANVIDVHSTAQKNKAGVSSKGGGRYVKEDFTTRLENNVRRLRSEVQSMRAVESQLRSQLVHLEHEDSLNRLRLTDQREKNESLTSEIAKITVRCRAERAQLHTMEQSLIEEKRLCQSLEEQVALIGEGNEGNLSIADVKTSTAVQPTGSSNGVVLVRQIEDGGDGVTRRSSSIADFAVSNTSLPPCPWVEPPCCQRRQWLESEVHLRHTSCQQRDEQMRLLSSVRMCMTPQQPTKCWPSKPPLLSSSVSCCVDKFKRGPPMKSNDSSDCQDSEKRLALESRVQVAQSEGERLNNKLREENWMKQELLTSYHNSVRDITDLNHTHKQRDCQILELTMKIEQLEYLASPHSLVPPLSTAEKSRSSTNRLRRDPLSDLLLDAAPFSDRLSNKPLSLSTSPHVVSGVHGAFQSPIIGTSSTTPSWPFDDVRAGSTPLPLTPHAHRNSSDHHLPTCDQPYQRLDLRLNLLDKHEIIHTTANTTTLSSNLSSTCSSSTTTSHPFNMDDHVSGGMTFMRPPHTAFSIPPDVLNSSTDLVLSSHHHHHPTRSSGVGSVHHHQFTAVPTQQQTH